MDDATIVSENVEIFQSAGNRSPFSWSAAIAGALAATAISFILIALGTGVGLAVASPYTASPSLGTMTIGGAVWLVLTQTIGFAGGGFVAGRLRAHVGPEDVAEVRFRDGTNGFMAWAIGAVVAALAITVIGAVSVVGGVRAVADATQSTSSDQLAYFVDALFRAPQSRQSGLSDQDRAQVVHIVAASVRNGGLSNDDRSYLAGLVAARTGLSQEEAQNRVTNVVNQVKQATDTARSAVAYIAFWTFMSLLFGAVASTLGGIWGGELRDESAIEQSRAQLLPS
jgi:hypothetical protein